MICSRIQIELLSKIVDSSMDWASCGLLNTRLPPCTGPPELPELLDGEDPDPQPASTARALPTIRAFVRKVLCLTSSSRGYVRTTAQPPHLVLVLD